MAEPYSVLLSLYRKESPAFLCEALDSMFSQTVPADEVVLVIDGPIGEELEDVVARYADAHPGVFRTVRSEKNLGLGLALNLGLAACKNELVARMDTDDISYPNRCEKQLLRFAEHPELSIVGGHVEEFNGTKENVISVRRVPTGREEIYAFARRRSAFNHPAVMYKKSAVLAVGGYSDLRRNQDVDLFGRMLFSGALAENLDEPVLWFRAEYALLARRRSWMNTKSYIAVIRKFRKMGYARLSDEIVVTCGQIVMFLLPLKLQRFVYKKILRR